MRRGDLVTVAAPGDYGKPRPALVIQSDLFAELPSVTLCLVTSDLRDAPIFRITVDPSSENGCGACLVGGQGDDDRARTRRRDDRPTDDATLLG
jgi:mRNA-degrading endonuclease toxin of MazEF toxin-antitoxin module